MPYAIALPRAGVEIGEGIDSVFLKKTLAGVLRRRWLLR
jgi:hypothetical protein